MRSLSTLKPEQKANLDLSSWDIALNGAEPIRLQTLEKFVAAFADCGFRIEAFYPSYGMAESTLFVTGRTKVLITPMVLSFANAQVLGTILSIGGSGWLFGAVLMSIWEGPKPRIKGVFGFELLLGLSILLMGLRPSVIMITAAAFCGFFSVPIIIGSANAIRQVKVAPEVQGRVFATWGAIAWSSFPLAYLIAGPLADDIFQPMLVKGGLLADSIGKIIGVGAGRGIGLLFILIGIFIILAAIIAYQSPRIRLVEDELPDAITDLTSAADSKTD